MEILSIDLCEEEEEEEVVLEKRRKFSIYVIAFPRWKATNVTLIKTKSPLKVIFGKLARQLQLHFLQCFMHVKHKNYR